MTKRIKPSKKAIVIIVAIVLVVGGLIIWRVSRQSSDHNAVGSNTPTFVAVLPEGKSIQAMGGWQRLDTPNDDVSYVFTDSINDVSIIVSQQEIPSSFKTSLDASVAELAREYNATDNFDVDGIKVYIGIKSTGQQSVVFTKKNLLVLIVSKDRISNDDWKQYIKSLI